MSKALELANKVEELLYDWTIAHECAIELRRLAAIEKELERIKALQPVRWEYRWTNPGDNPDQTESERSWHEIVPNNCLETADELRKGLLAYRYHGKPCYEARALFDLTQPKEQT